MAVALSILLVLASCAWPFFYATEKAEAATLVIAIDPGHGGGEAGAHANGVAEEEVNWSIANACVSELNTYSGVKAVLTKSYGQNMDREDRVNAAAGQGASAIVSIHCNSASASSANGCEVWVPNNTSYHYGAHVYGYYLGETILKKLSALGLKNRGVFTRSSDDTYYDTGEIADYFGINYYARLHDIPGIIVEHAFVTNPSDAAKLSSSEWQEAMGKADAQGIAEYYGLVKAGSAKYDENVKRTGSEIESNDPKIMGSSETTVAKMVSMFNSKGYSYPSSVYASKGAKDINEFCTILYNEAKAEGVRAEVVFVQAMLETGWLQFGGDVKAEQCNFCGLGATGGGVQGNSFASVTLGLRAQVQHLKAYASTDDLNQEKVDPRFNYVNPRGKAPTVRGLSGAWASDTSYGEKLVNLMNTLLGYNAAGANSAKLSLSDTSSSIADAKTVTAYVDGKATTMTVNSGYGTLDMGISAGTHSVVVYEYNKTSSNAHEVYPTKMYTWIVTKKSSGFVSQRYYGLDDLLQYGGCSIRVAGTKGIRLITGMSDSTKSMLANYDVNGYTLVETGTLIAWTDKVGSEGLTVNTSGVSRGKAFVAGSSDPVWNSSNGIEKYTNVLVGFSQVSQYKRDMTMRPYAILKDSSGNQFYVYGGAVQRSIQYIAEQNASAFKQGSDAYNYVHSIIDACK